MSVRYVRCFLMAMGGSRLWIFGGCCKVCPPYASIAPKALTNVRKSLAERSKQTRLYVSTRLICIVLVRNGNMHLRHYDSCNSLVSRRGSREVMDETWTAELLLQDTVIAFDSSQHTLDKAQRLLDSVGLNNTLSIQLRLAGVQRDWINSMDEDDLWDWHLA